VSTSGGRSAGRGLRERPLGRLLLLVGVLAAAFAASRSCAASGTTYDAKAAVRIARTQLDFTPRCVQVRYLRRGVESEPVWAVSLWTLAHGRFDRITVVVVAARTGRVLSVDRDPSTSSTPPQCSSPV